MELLYGSSVGFNPEYMNNYAKVYTYGAAVWIVFIAIVQNILIFTRDPRESIEDKGDNESALFPLIYQETNKKNVMIILRDSWQ